MINGLSTLTQDSNPAQTLSYILKKINIYVFCHSFFFLIPGVNLHWNIKLNIHYRYSNNITLIGYQDLSSFLWLIHYVYCINFFLQFTHILTPVFHLDFDRTGQLAAMITNTVCWTENICFDGQPIQADKYLMRKDTRFQQMRYCAYGLLQYSSLGIQNPNVKGNSYEIKKCW